MKKTITTNKEVLQELLFVIKGTAEVDGLATQVKEQGVALKELTANVKEIGQLLKSNGKIGLIEQVKDNATEIKNNKTMVYEVKKTLFKRSLYIVSLMCLLMCIGLIDLENTSAILKFLKLFV